MMGLSASAVDGLIKRARQNLREVLSEYLECYSMVPADCWRSHWQIYLQN